MDIELALHAQARLGAHVIRDIGEKSCFDGLPEDATAAFVPSNLTDRLHEREAFIPISRKALAGGVRIRTCEGMLRLTIPQPRIGTVAASEKHRRDRSGMQGH
jgi:hypothetical protein